MKRNEGCQVGLSRLCRRLLGCWRLRYSRNRNQILGGASSNCTELRGILVSLQDTVQIWQDSGSFVPVLGIPSDVLLNDGIR